MSSLGIDRLIGVPSVRPSNTPDRMRTLSDSLRWVTSVLWPGARRSRSGWMSASESGRRGGQPSTTAPTAPPCDSPHVVTRKRCPQVLPMRLKITRFAPPPPAPLYCGRHTSTPTRRSTMERGSTPKRVAFVQACWHREIVDQGRDAFLAEMKRHDVSADRIDLYEVPGSLEIPLQSKLLARTGKYAAIV